MYDPERGGFVDVGILDVLQIFGRSGRPQYDKSGHAIMITTQKSMMSYLRLLANMAPIESSLKKSLADHLNAEIVNGGIVEMYICTSFSLNYIYLLNGRYCEQYYRSSIMAWVHFPASTHAT